MQRVCECAPPLPGPEHSRVLRKRFWKETCATSSLGHGLSWRRCRFTGPGGTPRKTGRSPMMPPVG
ncbi:MAG: hypothetical protein MZU95_09790 [Desulfomicrobium escambiense]|nr:hypothetical protein [Desulfomicrobium escambiense]